jgi:hypothetical protein
MKSAVLLWSFVALAGCTSGASSSGDTSSSGASSSGAGSSGGATVADASVAASASDPGLACAGPYMRGAERGTRACRNAEGGWTVLGCSRCTASSAGVCAHPAIPNEVQISASSAQGGGLNPTPPRDQPAGSCSPACCDNTLALLPEGVEDNFPTMR